MSSRSENYSYVVVLLVLGALWYLIGNHFYSRGDYSINRPIFEIIVFMAFFFLGQATLWKSRYNMPHVTVNGHSGSIGVRPVPVGDYLIFACGESFDPVHIRGKISTLVVPKSHVRRAGRNYVALTHVKYKPILNLPPEVHRFLYHNRKDFNLQNVYFGKYSEPFELANERLIDYEQELENQNILINKLTRLVEGDNDILVEQMNTARELAKEKKSLFALPQRKPEDEVP